MGKNFYKKFLSLLVFVILMTAFFAAQADDGVMFGYRFEEGASNDYKVKYTQEVDFGGFAYSQIVDLQVTEKCVGVSEDGKYDMEMVFNKIESSRMQFDKMVEDNSFEPLVAQAVSYTIDKHGAVEDIKAVGYVENWTMISQSITSVMQTWYAYLPGDNVPVGGSWKDVRDKEDNGAGLLISIDSKFSYDEKKTEKGRDCAKISAKMTQKIEGVSSTQMGDYQTDGDGKGELEFLFATSDAVMVKLKSKFELKMHMTPASGSGQEVETIVNMQLERELM